MIGGRSWRKQRWPCSYLRRSWCLVKGLGTFGKVQCTASAVRWRWRPGSSTAKCSASRQRACRLYIAHKLGCTRWAAQVDPDQQRKQRTLECFTSRPVSGSRTEKRWSGTTRSRRSLTFPGCPQIVQELFFLAGISLSLTFELHTCQSR